MEISHFVPPGGTSFEMTVIYTFGGRCRFPPLGNVGKGVLSYIWKVGLFSIEF